MSDQQLMIRATMQPSVFDPHRFEHAQRVAKMLASSELVPAQFRGKVADCVIAQELANRVGASVLAVMQSLIVIHGNPSWKASAADTGSAATVASARCCRWKRNICLTSIR